MRHSSPLPGHEGIKEDRIVRFATIQLFVIFYLEKFAVGPPRAGSQISLPLLVMAACLTWEVVSGRMTFSPIRLALYSMFVACCLLSQVLTNVVGSMLSMMEMFLMYGFMTVSARVTVNGYLRVLNNLVKLMVVPAIIVLVQYGYQTATGGGDPISMNLVAPKALLAQGFVYDAHYPLWNSPFQRPNGFFFLEPSFVSFFCASAAIVELTYFRRPLYAALMVAATVLSTGATGLTMFVVASPFLLARESPKLVMPLIVIGVLGLLAALLAGADFPVISRMNELDERGSSGSARLVVPLQDLIRYLSDPSYLFTGQGAGATTLDAGSPWPITKITFEYGIIPMLAFVALYVAVFWGNYNLPLKMAVTVVFNFTGAYLLNSEVVQFFALLFCIVVPIRDRASRPYMSAPALSRDAPGHVYMHN